MAKEQWRPVPGFEGRYEVSDLGRVRSLERIVYRSDGRQRIHAARMRTPVPTGKDGRKDLLLSKDGVHKHFRVATLVLLAFVGPRPPGMEACHANGDASDDRLENLRWDTSSANKFDTVRHGNHHMTKHTECPLEHPLVKPNLVPSRLRDGHRVCRACTWARAACQRAEKRGEPYDLAAEAAIAFDRIMSFVVPGSDSESEDRRVVS